jgi:hypothetical protein
MKHFKIKILNLSRPNRGMDIMLFKAQAYIGTHNNKIHTIYKPTSVFVLVFFHVVVSVLLAKQQQQQIRQFIYDLSMLCLALFLLSLKK